MSNEDKVVKMYEGVYGQVSSNYQLNVKWSEDLISILYVELVRKVDGKLIDTVTLSHLLFEHITMDW